MELVFLARQAESKFKDCFFKAGGLVVDAVARGPTEFCLSGSQFVTTIEFLYNDESKVVRVPFPDGSDVDSLDADMRLMMAGTRSVMSSGGTNVDVVSGTAGTLLLDILNAGDSGILIPMSYGGSSGYVATVLVQQAKITLAGNSADIITLCAAARNCELKQASRTLLEEASNATWEARTKKIIYSHAPTLTKLEIQTAPNSGVGSGDATFTGTFVNGSLPFAMETIDDLMGFSIQTLMSTASPGLRAAFARDTRAPGLAAAGHAETLGTCLSILVSFIMVYRGDKSCTATSNGLRSTSFENWQQSCTRSALFAGDCEDGAKLICDIVNAVCSTNPVELSRYPKLKLIRNTMVPYYMRPCLAVIGASAPSAGRFGNSPNKRKVAGHCAAAFLSALEYAEARDRGKRIRRDTQPTRRDGEPDLEYVFKSIFNEEAKRGLPELEKGWLTDYETARKHIPHLTPLIIETTTPSSSRIWGASDITSSREVTGTIERLGLDIPRTLSNVSSRGFYRHIVELIYPYKFHPEWKDAELRKLGKVSNHYAVTSRDDPSVCGVDPEKLSSSCFALVPLYEHGAFDANIIDTSVAMSEKNVMGPRRTPHSCDKRRNSNIDRSLRALESTDDQTYRIIDMGYDSIHHYLSSTTPDSSLPREHPFAVHTVPYCAICENPTLLETICKRIKQSGAHVAVELFRTKGLDGCAASDTHESVVATLFEFSGRWITVLPNIQNICPLRLGSAIVMQKPGRPPYPKPIFSFPRDSIDAHLEDDRDERWRLPLLRKAMSHHLEKIGCLLSVSCDDRLRPDLIRALCDKTVDEDPDERVSWIIDRIFLVAPTVQIVCCDPTPDISKRQKLIPVAAEDKVAIVDSEIALQDRDVIGNRRVVVVFSDTAVCPGKADIQSKATLDLEYVVEERRVYAVVTGTNGLARSETIDLENDGDEALFSFDLRYDEAEKRLKRKRKMYPERSGQVTAGLMSCVATFIQQSLHGDLVRRGIRENERPLCFEPMQCKGPKGSRDSVVIAHLHALTTSCACGSKSGVQCEVFFILSSCGRRLRSGPQGESGNCDVHQEETIVDEGSPGFCCSSTKAKLVCKHVTNNTTTSRSTSNFPIATRDRRRLGSIVAMVAWAGSCTKPGEARRRSKLAYQKLQHCSGGSCSNPPEIRRSRVPKCDWYDTWLCRRNSSAHAV